MTTDLEHEITAVLRSHASAADIAPAPMARLVREGDRLASVRSRRTALASVAATVAAVAAILVPVGVTTLDRSAPPPEPATTAPGKAVSEADIAIPIATRDGSWRLRGRRFDAGESGPVGAHGVYFATHDSLDYGAGPADWQLLSESGPEPAPYLRGADLPILVSPDGRYVVATRRADGGPVVWVTDFRTGSEVGRWRIPTPDCCDDGAADLLGIDTSGRVYWASEWKIWVRGLRGQEPREPVAVASFGNVDALPFATGRGPVLLDANGRYVSWRLDANQKLDAPVGLGSNEGAMVWNNLPFWNARGTKVAFMSGDVPTIFDLATRQTSPVPLESGIGGRLDLLGWYDERLVIVEEPPASVDARGNPIPDEIHPSPGPQEYEIFLADQRGMTSVSTFTED